MEPQSCASGNISFHPLHSAGPSWNSPLKDFGWIPSNKLPYLQRLGLQTLQDLLMHFPRRYEDRRKFPDFPEGPTETAICVYGTIVKTAVRRYRGGRSGFEAVLERNGASAFGQRLLCRWFNAYYVQRMLATGQNIVVFGKAKQNGRQVVMDHPEFEVVEQDDETSIHFNRLTPIHAAGEGVTARALREWIYRALQEVDLTAFPSLIPELENEVAYGSAVQQAHFPESWELLQQVRSRLALEEFFAMQLVIASRRRRVSEMIGRSRQSEGKLLQALIERLPFKLTRSQQEVIEEIRRDLAAPRAMHRLLQGDVGSGKTLVALASALLVVEAGFQAAIMAPTQILAEQHYVNFHRILESLGVRVALRTGNRREDSALPLFDGDGEPQIIVGTHALLFEGVSFSNLGLAVIDEQHKFGVLQRAKLLDCGDAPDLLVMTATPIPRTLTQTIYGDLDVSILREKPANRGKIITAARRENKLPEITRFLREKLLEGRQAYIVYPLVEESDKLSAKAASEEHRKWQQLLSPFVVELLHGRMTPEEKEAVMERFRSNAAQVLIATTVIEVGIDVANASVMLIENAERFGLAQLHQLRGRVGRGEHKSYCILVHAATTPEAEEKLQVLEQTNDGFEIAEADLRLRGPGDLIGTAQTGLPPLRAGNLLRDGDIVAKARQLVDHLLKIDRDLIQPQHQLQKAFLQHQQRRIHAAGG